MKRKLLTLILVLASVFGIFAVVGKNVEAKGDKTWSVTGTVNGWNPADTTYDMKWVAANDRYEVVVTFKKGDLFKITRNHGWNNAIGWDGWSTDKGKSDYLKCAASDQNFEVTVAGDYLIYLYDNDSAGYGFWAGDMGIEPYSATKFTVTYNAETVVTEEYTANQKFHPKFIEKEGYKLVGWYTDSALTTEFAKGTAVTSNLSLYPKYVEATDYVIYLVDSSNVLGSAVSAYMWSDVYGHDNTWPGVALEKTSDRGWKLTVTASKSFDRIIFNGNSKQTVDLVLTDANAGDTFVLGKANTEGKYAATVNATGVVYGLQDLVSSYYKEGTYTRTTNIYIDKTAIAADFGKHFHNPQGGENVILDRTTEFVKDYLYFVETKTAFGTDANGNLTEFKWNGSYEHSTSGKNAIEDTFVTLHDFLSLSEGWTVNNGVYTNTTDAAIKAAEAFTAPGWQSPDTNYTSYSQVTISVVEGKLCIQLWVSAINSGIVTSAPVGAHALFSQAIIG